MTWPVANPIKLFYLPFFIFADQICLFTINDFFIYVTNTQTYQQKTEIFFVTTEKSFIGSAIVLDCLFALLGSELVKVVVNMLIKSTLKNLKHILSSLKLASYNCKSKWRRHFNMLQSYDDETNLPP